MLYSVYSTIGQERTWTLGEKLFAGGDDGIADGEGRCGKIKSNGGGSQFGLQRMLATMYAMRAVQKKTGKRKGGGGLVYQVGQDLVTVV